MKRRKMTEWVLDNAVDLLSDGSNPEYDRAIAELTADVLQWSREEAAAVLRSRRAAFNQLVLERQQQLAPSEEAKEERIWLVELSREETEFHPAESILLTPGKEWGWFDVVRGTQATPSIPSGVPIYFPEPDVRNALEFIWRTDCGQRPFFGACTETTDRVPIQFHASNSLTISRRPIQFFCFLNNPRFPHRPALKGGVFFGPWKMDWVLQ